MKFITTTLLCLLVCIGTVFLTGCPLLAGTAKAAEAYEQTEKDVAAAKQAVTKLAEEMAGIKREYDAAVKAGDTTKAQLLFQAGTQAMAKYEAANEAFETSKTALNNAIQRFKDSKSTEDYLGNIFGILAGVAGGLLGGGGGVGGFLGKKLQTLGSAVKKTAANVDTFIPMEQWEAFTKSQREDMTPAERSLFDKAAGLKV